MDLRYKKTLKRIGLFAAVFISVVAGVFISFRLAIFLLPFLIAFALSSLMEPLIKFLDRKLRIKRSIGVPIALVILAAIIATLLFVIVITLIKEIKILVMAAPKFLSTLYIQITCWLDELTMDLEWLPPEIFQNLETFDEGLAKVIANLSNTITDFGKSVVKGAYITATSLPEMLIFIIITITATYFIAKDRHRIASAFRRHLPAAWLNRLLDIKKDMFFALFAYLKSALIMMLITFGELFIGFSIIRLRYTLLLAILIAVIDALPILGVGTVLLPWSLYSFLTANIKMGVSLLVLYLVILTIRQMVEPKVLSHQIGIHPLLTLMAMYSGLRLMGFAGIIAGPVTFLLIRNILISIYKDKPLKEIIGFSQQEENKKTTIKQKGQ